jgi:tRNA threonylcarbamoyladenosine biosynthesis protein TsaB
VTTLVIENSSAPGSLTVARECVVVHERVFRGAGELATEVARAIELFARLDRVIVGIGPGSYTGLRVSIATAFGLSLATDCQRIGCPSILGFAESDYTVIGDARRGSFFFARVADRVIAEGPRLLPKTELSNLVGNHSGIPLFAVGPMPELPEVEVKVPSARFLLGKEANYVPLGEPIYLKEPHITQSRSTGLME